MTSRTHLVYPVATAEIEAGVVKLTEIIGSAGVSTQVAAENLTAFFENYRLSEFGKIGTVWRWR